MAEERQRLNYDCTTVNNLLDTVNNNKDVFPFDVELNESSPRGVPNSVIAKEINALKGATSNNKGYFLTEEKLLSAYPIASEGFKAYVGSNYPYAIYLYQGGRWVDTGETGGDDTFVASEFYTKIQIDQQHEAINNEIARVEKGANYEVLEYEVNIATTRLKVEEDNRKGGYMITYNAGTGWIKEQYIGTAVTNEEWIKDENWKAEVLDENIQAIAENAQQQAELAATNAALAEEKATEAATQAAYAKEQGDLAAERGGVPEAPSDDKQYARKNETWDEIISVGMVDPNSDGTGEVFNIYEGDSMNVAKGKWSHAECCKTTAEGESSHAEGYNTTASGYYSHAEGNSTVASNNCSHAEGYGTTASGYYSHAEGNSTVASSTYSHAEGDETTASGYNSHAEGNETTASGYYSHTSNRGTLAENYSQTSVGSFNEKDNNPSINAYNSGKPVFVIGNGATDTSRGNAFKVLFNGQTFADGEYSSAGADYAEQFEWKDGNPLNEDRVGKFVTLKGKNIEIADETSIYILGIVSGAPTIIGDNPMRWHNKYANDEWGRPIYEDVEVTYKETEVDDEGNSIEVEKTRIDHVRKLNPLYNPQEKYIPRAERQEWDFIGMMGKLLVRQDGTLTEGGFCKPSANGVATTAESGYYVMEIINESQALILFR